MPDIAIRNASYRDCQKTIHELLNLFDVDVKGKSVLLKPNVLRPSEPEEAVTTHPAFLKAAINAVKDLGASKVMVGDNHGGAGGMNRRAFEITGLLEAAGEHYVNLGADPVEVAFNSRFASKVIVSRPVLECDVFITLPKFKTHASTGVTCAIKNSYGILPGAQKGRFHVITGNPVDFAELVLDVFSVRKPDFVLVDAILGMEGNGPASKTLRYIGQIIAGRDSIAIDTLVARMMGIKPEALKLLTLAAERGLGPADFGSINIDGEPARLENFLLPPLFQGGVMGQPSGGGFRPQKQLPVADEASCTRCSLCIEECPAGALKMEGVPVVDESLCVICCCCQELCPTGSMQVRKV